MRLALAQLNPLVGDLIGNAKLIKAACLNAAELNADLLLTPELSLWGYPPRDLLLHRYLIEQQKEILDEIAKTLTQETPNLKVLVGLAESAHDLQVPKLFNSIALIESTGWQVIARKQLLPTYDVFDEKRYFRPAQAPSVLDLNHNGKEWHIGVTICEDLWVEEALQKQRISGPDPIGALAKQKIDLLVNLSASPFSHSKDNLRQQLAAKASARLNCPVIYLNQVGGNDELVFDGGSFVLNNKAEILLKLPSYCEGIGLWDTESTQKEKPISLTTQQEDLFQALTLGVRDYARKCGFNSAIVGLSGGIDSALVAIIAAAALGTDKVTAVMMPSPWNSANSVEDALALAQRLGLQTHKVPIADLMESFDAVLEKPLGKLPEGVTAENLQSRIRGTLLMALANQQGHLLLSTGNKSELAVGYCTLYGDMNGGLSVIGDLYKTCIFNLCKWLDSDEAQPYRQKIGLPCTGEIIGKNIRQKPPSAELRPGQLDSDSLPDYSLLDPILKSIIEDRLQPEAIIKKGHDPNLVTQVMGMLKKGEFKRRQAPPLLKVSNQAFGSGWRLPIAAK